MLGSGLVRTPKGQERKSGVDPWFEVAGSDGVWHAANAEIKDSCHVSVWSSAVARPVSVRYLWHETATSVDLRNSEGLCAFPFIMQ